MGGWGGGGGGKGGGSRATAGGAGGSKQIMGLSWLAMPHCRHGADTDAKSPAPAAASSAPVQGGAAKFALGW